MHRHVVQRAGLEHAYPLSAMPENEALEGMAAGLAAAWTEVRRRRSAVQAVMCHVLMQLFVVCNCTCARRRWATRTAW